MTSAELVVGKEWLEDIINQKFQTQESIEDYHCSVISDGKGFLSIVTKVDITWSHKGVPHGNDRSKLPTSLVIKNPTDEKIRKIILVENFFKDNYLARVHNAEVNAYTYFNLHGTPPLPIPQVIYARKFTDNEPGLMILEFVEGRSLTLNEDNTFEQMQELVKVIASVQAYGINHGQLEKYFGPLQSNFLELSLPDVHGNVAKMNQLFPGILELDKERIDRVVSRLQKINSTLKDPSSQGDHQVLSLGDVQPNNVFWKTNQDGSLTNTISAVMDFQVIHRGTSLYDFCSATFWGLTSDRRRKHQDTLLQLYHDTLKAKTGGKAPLTLCEVRKEYRRYMVVLAVMYFPFILQMPDLKDSMHFTDERIRQLADKAASVFDDGFDLDDSFQD